MFKPDEEPMMNKPSRFGLNQQVRHREPPFLTCNLPRSSRNVYHGMLTLSTGAHTMTDPPGASCCLLVSETSPWTLYTEVLRRGDGNVLRAQASSQVFRLEPPCNESTATR